MNDILKFWYVLLPFWALAAGLGYVGAVLLKTRRWRTFWTCLIGVGLGWLALYFLGAVLVWIDPPTAYNPPDSGLGVLDFLLTIPYAIAYSTYGLSHIMPVLFGALGIAVAFIVTCLLRMRGDHT